MEMSMISAALGEGEFNSLTEMAVPFQGKRAMGFQG
jgi:hypothetical protein